MFAVGKPGTEASKKRELFTGIAALVVAGTWTIFCGPIRICCVTGATPVGVRTEACTEIQPGRWPADRMLPAREGPLVRFWMPSSGIQVAMRSCHEIVGCVATLETVAVKFRVVRRGTGVFASEGVITGVAPPVTFTVTGSEVTDMLLIVADAVIEVAPAVRGVTTPVLETLATAGLLDAQVSVTGPA